VLSEFSKMGLVSVFRLQFKDLVSTINLHIVTATVTNVMTFVHRRTGKKNHKKSQVIIRSSAQIIAL
jgi:hypothetical protein